MYQQEKPALPENFISYPDARKIGFMNVKRLKDEGRRVVGFFCTYVPTELMYAADAVPVTLCAFTDDPIPAAEAHLPRNLCPLIKASYGFALTDTCPFFYFSDLIVGETTCDGKKKVFELMNEIKDTYVLQLPHQRNDYMRDVWKHEIIKFKEKLEDFYGITITDEDVREAVRRKNRERTVMKEFLELGKLSPAPISGYELGSRLDAGAYDFDLEAHCDEIEARTKEVREYWERELKGKPNTRPRLLVTGCPNSGVRDKIIKAVEDMGADVVTLDACNGIKEKIDLVDADAADIYEALAKKYMDISCSIMSPNGRRLDYIEELIQDYQVDGVIEIILQSCHTYDIESYSVKRLVSEKLGKPYLSIETDYSKSDTGQIGTRLEAFLETIE